MIHVITGSQLDHISGPFFLLGPSKTKQSLAINYQSSSVRKEKQL